MTLHPFRKGNYPGSGQARMVLAEAGLDGKSQTGKEMIIAAREAVSFKPSQVLTKDLI
jgi:hypothetical protein